MKLCVSYVTIGVDGILAEIRAGQLKDRTAVDPCTEASVSMRYSEPNYPVVTPGRGAMADTAARGRNDGWTRLLPVIIVGLTVFVGFSTAVDILFDQWMIPRRAPSGRI